ncbi:hypothetical protein DX910_14710 [Acinetobacter haemolyticus]|nr:hypothetical protein DX910_14710 [Acinetobacter haemolyticus]
MANIDLKTRDYIVDSLDENFDADLFQAVIMRLNIHRGKYWANPNLGSRFYLLKRSKDVPRNKLLAIQYAEEALADLVPGRIADLDVTASQNERSRLNLHIEITLLTGQKQNIIYFVPVGG